ncbi:MAG: DUF4282 domain-containing protein [Phycisphaeraceae bacterium]|nr:MAG: DUF4282 domain-containing protein [Phycisphaeraceae bacterium]
MRIKPKEHFSSGDMKEFLSFRTMITPRIIQILFLFFVALVVLSGLIQIIAGLANNSLRLAFSGLMMIVVGPILVRIYCELLIVIFRIYDTLREIRDGRTPLNAPD